MTDREVVLAAVLVAAVAWWAPSLPVWVALPFVALAWVSRRPAAVALALALLAGSLAHRAIEGLDVAGPADVEGWVTLVGDPSPARFGWNAEVREEATGRHLRMAVPSEHTPRIRTMLAGERVWVRGRVRPWRDRPAWATARHLTARLTPTELGDTAPGAPWHRAANAVHRSLARPAAGWDPDRRSLYLGFVLGDDRDQSDALRARFRASGLGHLTAVSGQNVVFVLTVAAPLLARLAPTRRWLATIVIISAFALLTRFEPSVVRAAVMAGTSATVAWRGRAASTLRVLAVTVIVSLLLDPLLVRSLGFQLSVSATLGLVAWSGPLARRLPGPELLRTAAAATLAATAGTVPLSLLAFGAVPTAALPANLLAEPPSGLVMTAGLPLALLGLVVPGLAHWLVQPLGWAVWFVDRVSWVCARAPMPVLGPAATALMCGAAAAWWWASGTTSTGRRRRVLGPTAVAVLAIVPLTVGLRPVVVGSEEVHPGVELVTGGCGGRALVVSGGAAVLPVVESLWRRNVRSLDAVVLAGDTRGVGRTAMQLGEVVPVGVVVSAGAALPGTVPLADNLPAGFAPGSAESPPVRPAACAR